MAASWQSLCDTFWSSSFWLPTGFTWDDLSSDKGDVYFPRVQDMNLSIVVGVFFLLVRYVYERLIVIPLGRYLGIKERRRHVEPNTDLEQGYRGNRGKPSQAELELLSKKTDKTVREIERWFFKRRLKDSPTAMAKFQECSWLFLFYLCSFTSGIFMMWDREWFWDIKNCFEGWPNHHVDTSLHLFVLAEIGFYWSLLFSAFKDPKRLDFWEMTIHHCITIALIYFSWVINFVRIGALIIVVHDVADYWLAACKMAKYSKRQTLCEVLFAGFFLTWVVSRMYVYPFVILKSIINELPNHVPTFVSLRAFMFLLCTLQVLHAFWTYLLLKMALQKFTHGSLQKDVRSDPESDSALSENDQTTTKIMNGTKKIARNNNG